MAFRLRHWSQRESSERSSRRSWFPAQELNMGCWYCSVTKSCPTLCDPMNPHQDFLSFTSSWSLLKLMPVELAMPSNHLILCHPLLLLPSILPSIRVFYNELAFCIRWPNFWSLSINPSNEYLRLISFRIDCFDLLAVQGTLEFSLTPQLKKHHFFGIQLSLGSNFHIHTWLLESP